MDMLLLLVLFVLVAVLFPIWPYSRRWGYRPAGVAGLILVIVIFLIIYHIGPF